MHTRKPFLDSIEGPDFGYGVSRRQAIGSFAFAASAFLPLSSACAVQANQEFTPEMFGARGDGIADDYPALIRLAAAVSRAGGGTVRFGRRRRYRIGQVQVIGGPGRNDVAHVTFESCNGLTVDLNEAIIDVKGDFHRGADAGGGRQSHVNAVIPLRFNRCSNLVVRNGTLNGNVQRMTRAPSVGEQAGHGIALVSCSRVLLEDLYVHHFSSDGLHIRAGTEMRVCRDVRMNRLRLTNNARQGLSNVGGSGIVAADCAFSENGRTGGSYRHPPGAGVDIEPLREYDLPSDFRATRCRFDDNLGSPLVVGNPDHSSSVELVDCSGRRSAQGRLNLASERAVVRGGTWHNIQIACGYGANRRFRNRIAIEVSGGTWTGDDPAWSPVYDLSRQDPSVHIHGNNFQLRSPQPFVRTYLFQCANPNHRFEDNEIFVSGSGHDGSDDDLIGQFGGAIVRGNSWTTDVRAPMRFVNNYQGARLVERERFSGSFAATGARL